MTLAERRFPGDPARPALALHCMMGSSAGWAELAAGLDGRVTLTVLDLPGHGRSPVWSGEPFAKAVMDGARPVLDRLAAEAPDGRVDLMGHSFGAVMALHLAIEDPSRIRSLSLVEPVLFAAVPPEHRDPEGLIDHLAAAEAAGDRAAATAVFLRHWGGPDPARLAAAVRDQLDVQMGAVLAVMEDLYHDRGDILRPGGLESLDLPVMLISGADTPGVIARIAAALAARLPDVGRATVPGAGHMAPLTHPQAVAGLIAVNLERA